LSLGTHQSTDGGLKKEVGLTTVASGSSGVMSGVDAGGRRLLSRTRVDREESDCLCKDYFSALMMKHVRYVLDSSLASPRFERIFMRCIRRTLYPLVSI